MQNYLIQVLIIEKSGIKNGTEVNLNLSSNLIGNSNDKTNFPHKLLLTETQFWTNHKAFANGSSANISFSKIQLSKMIQSWGFAIINISIFDFMSPFKRADKTANKAEGLFNRKCPLMM